MSFRDYETLTKLGEGSFGQVFKVRRIQDRGIYVMKQINTAKMSQKLKKEALNEVEILSRIDSCYVVKYFDSFIDKNYLCIIMEYCELGDLHKALKGQFGRPLSENSIWAYFIQMLLGLNHLHSLKILHRDLKTLNVFLAKDNQVRIGDLGVAKVLSEQNNFARTMVGTPYYISPEMCEEKPYNEKSDIWALGCMLYEMCTFKHPFEAQNQGALYLKIIRGKYEPVKTYSEMLSNMIDKCLQRDYRSRPTSLELLQLANVKQMAGTLCISLKYKPHPLTNTFKKQIVKAENKEKQTEAQKQYQSQAVQKPIIQNKPLVRQSGPLGKLLGIDQQQEVQNKQPQFEVVGRPAPEQAIQIRSSAFQINKYKPEAKLEVKQEIKVEIKEKNRYEPKQPEIKVEMKQEQKVEPKQQLKLEAKPEIRVDQKQQEVKNVKIKDSPLIMKVKDQQIKESQVKESQVVKQQGKQSLEPKEKPKQVKQVGQNIFHTPQMNKEKLVNLPYSHETPDQRKRVRKGAPTELARQVQVVGQKRIEKQQSQQQNEVASEKSKSNGNKKNLKNKAESFVKQDFIDVESLPEKVTQKSRRNQVNEIDNSEEEYQVQDAQQKEIINIDEFFKNHLQQLKSEELKNSEKTVKTQFQQHDSEMNQQVEEIEDEPVEDIDVEEQEQELEEDGNQPYGEEVEEEEEVRENNIPITYVGNNRHEEGNLIMFEEEEEFEQEEQKKDSDQEAYSEKEYDEEEQNENDIEFEGQKEEKNEGDDLNDTLEYDEITDEVEQYKCQTIKEDPREMVEDSTQIDQSIEEQDDENRGIQVIIDKRILELNKTMLENQKRKTELEMIMQAKTRECVRELGQKSFGEVLTFFRGKLNSEKELDQKDQEEIDFVVQTKFVNSRNPQIIYTIYKILHFEIEILKCQEKIYEVQRELDS